MLRYRLFGAVAAASIGLDQLSKVWARHALPTNAAGEGVPVQVIHGYWDWILQFNTGSAFSLFTGGLGSRIFLSLIAVAAVGVMLYLVRGVREEQKALLVAFGLMAGGALGNLIDRIAFGRVTDFVLWHLHDSYWPVFNIADVCLVVAVPMFLLFGYRGEKRRSAAPA